MNLLTIAKMKVEKSVIASSSWINSAYRDSFSFYYKLARMNFYI